MVVCMTASPSQFLIATGNQQGHITVWDIETGRIDAIHFASNAMIISLQFVDDYPILLAGGQDGSITAWATKRAPKNIQRTCLGRFHNGSNQNSKLESQIGDLYTCGTSILLNILGKYKIFSSDKISFHPNGFPPEACRKDSDQSAESVDSDLDGV